MDARAKGGVFLGTNAEYHDANGAHIPSDEAERRIKEHEDAVRKAGRKPDRERLADEERQIRLTAARQAAERTGLTGALRDIDRANATFDEDISAEDSPMRDRVDAQDRLSPAMTEASEVDRANAQRVDLTDANVPASTSGAAAESGASSETPNVGPSNTAPNTNPTPGTGAQASSPGAPKAKK